MGLGGSVTCTEGTATGEVMVDKRNVQKTLKFCTNESSSTNSCKSIPAYWDMEEDMKDREELCWVCLDKSYVSIVPAYES
eukprot:TCALIF_02906-PA protein Name:"Protein of unknown function" AED:0.62 eAED:1.00 QI:0/0/0/0.5/1/1/2/0/79